MSERPVGTVDCQIKFRSDFQPNWAGLIRPLRRNGYRVETAATLSIQGDAPKNFVCIKEYASGRRNRPSRWPKYIAKLGSKSYPVESITEHLLTRIGQLCSIVVASSQLRFFNCQVRFLSRYFLGRNETLVHGIELFQGILDESMVKQIASERRESEFYTFQTVKEAVAFAFPDHSNEIMNAFVAMLAFDALVGNNDRHPANWGVIVSIRKGATPRFAPVYDTARALFWNNSETDVQKRLNDDAMLRAYVKKSKPLIGWNGSGQLSHFELVAQIDQNYPAYRPVLVPLTDLALIDACGRILEEEFGPLMSQERRQVIRKCLALRQKLYSMAVTPGPLKV
jgi:hypothetical protein